MFVKYKQPNVNVLHGFHDTTIKVQDKNKTLPIKQLILTHPPLTTHVEVIFSIILVTYLFMCATEGQAFDDLFVIIFISSQEKF